MLNFINTKTFSTELTGYNFSLEIVCTAKHGDRIFRPYITSVQRKYKLNFTRNIIL